MRAFGTMAAALRLVGAIAIGTTAPAAGDWYGHHHRYYNYYGGGGGTWNGCRPGWSVQVSAWPVALLWRPPERLRILDSDISKAAAALTGGLFFAGSDGSDRSHLFSRTVKLTALRLDDDLRRGAA
jgi:hypothetical protein